MFQKEPPNQASKQAPHVNGQAVLARMPDVGSLILQRASGSSATQVQIFWLSSQSQVSQDNRHTCHTFTPVSISVIRQRFVGSSVTHAHVCKLYTIPELS